MASSSFLRNLSYRFQGYERNLSIFEGGLTFLKTDISEVPKMISDQLTPAAQWGISVGVSGIGLAIMVSLIVAYVRDN
jgi:hypothetical protein